MTTIIPAPVTTPIFLVWKYRCRQQRTHQSIVATPTKDGGRVLDYQNFSIVTHAKRRMALFTASNVTADPELKQPERRRVYTRKGLTGLGDRDVERWFPDPRMSEDYQLPDVFYTRDDGAFDKGHVVRRDDVAWGATYEIIRRANGDTYHVTNCSPQVAGFNRSSLGEDNWGELEEHVFKSAVSERYCQFAGPVLDDKDDIFLGRGGGRVRLSSEDPVAVLESDRRPQRGRHFQLRVYSRAGPVGRAT